MSLKEEYQELIDELKDEMGDGLLNKNSVIQVLRDEKADQFGYFPIIDWYYNKQTMIQELAPDKTDSKEDIKDKQLIKQQYDLDLPFLKDMTVEACLAEMFEKCNKK